MAKKGKNVWKELKGVKETLTEDLNIRMGEVEVTIPIKFIDYDEIQEINEEYQDKLPEKPTVRIDVGSKTIKVKLPRDSEEDKYASFNDHHKAQEWVEKTKPIEKERKLRLAYEFIADEYKPGESMEEGLEILKENLREIDRLNIIEKGFELNGISDRMEKAEKN